MEPLDLESLNGKSVEDLRRALSSGAFRNIGAPAQQKPNYDDPSFDPFTGSSAPQQAMPNIFPKMDASPLARLADQLAEHGAGQPMKQQPSGPPAGTMRVPNVAPGALWSGQPFNDVPVGQPRQLSQPTPQPTPAPPAATQPLGLADAAATQASAPSTAAAKGIDMNDPYAGLKASAAEFGSHIGYGQSMPMLGSGMGGGSPTDPQNIYQQAYQKAFQQGGFIDTRDMSPEQAARIQLGQQSAAQNAAQDVLRGSLENQKLVGDSKRYELQYGDDAQKKSALQEVGKAAAAEVLKNGGSGEEAAAAYRNVVDAEKSQKLGLSAAPTADIGTLRSAAQKALTLPGAKGGVGQPDVAKLSSPSAIDDILRSPAVGSPEARDSFAKDIDAGKYGPSDLVKAAILKRAIYHKLMLTPESQMPAYDQSTPYAIQGLPAQFNPNRTAGGQLLQMANPLNLGASYYRKLNEIQTPNGLRIPFDSNDMPGGFSRGRGNNGLSQQVDPNLAPLIERLYGKR